MYFARRRRRSNRRFKAFPGLAGRRDRRKWNQLVGAFLLLDFQLQRTSARPRNIIPKVRLFWPFITGAASRIWVISILPAFEECTEKCTALVVHRWPAQQLKESKIETIHFCPLNKHGSFSGAFFISWFFRTNILLMQKEKVPN